MERYIALHKTDGTLVKAGRIKSNDSDAILRAKLFFTLPESDRKNIDLSDTDFTGKMVSGVEGCRFRNSNLTGAKIGHAKGCDFSGANLTGAAFFGDCSDMYLKDANLTGLQAAESRSGIFVGGYFVDGSPVVANKRGNSWWLSVSVEGRKLYFPYLETSAVIYGQSLSDEVVTNLVQIISRVRGRIMGEETGNNSTNNPAQELSQGLKRNQNAVSHINRVEDDKQEFVST